MTDTEVTRTAHKSVRLPHYDYSSPGAYFVTLVTVDRECVFGEIIEGGMVLNEIGCIVDNEWQRSAELREELEIDLHVIMPNHLHGVVLLTETGPAHCRAALRSGTDLRHSRQRSPRSLSSFIAGFKGYTTKLINEHRGTPGARLWQPSFYEHVIRDEQDLAQVREYIANNPLKWHLDKENPDRTP